MVNLLSERDIHVYLSGQGDGGGGGEVGFPNTRIDGDTVGVLVRKKFESPFTTSSTNKYICYSQCCC